MPSTKTMIFDALYDLLEDEFKEFKWRLTNKETLEKSIPRGKLEKANRQDVVDLMEQQFGTSDAGKITVRVLHSINQNNLADQLKKQLQEVPDGDSASSSNGVAPTGGGVVMNLNCTTGGNIKAPVIHGNVFNGSLTFN